jgi:hypothetical protein
MLTLLLFGGLVSFVNFGIHAAMTGLIIVATHRAAGRVSHLHAVLRMSALLAVTVAILTVAHVVEIFVWAAFLHLADVTIQGAATFEFAFENFTALGYGDALATGGWRAIGPIASLNGLLLIGWSVAIIFEVMRMAEVQIGWLARRD